MRSAGLAVIGAGVLLAGCGSEQAAGPLAGTLAITSGQQSLAQGAPRPVEIRDEDAEVEARLVQRKTVAAKVLAALALERVTGLKPDPSRLVQVR
jgi:hypothetical protein